ncbi:MAG TPA: hypothetical protein VFG38_16500, partial [Pseudomonadales bacterium]|nr:hypothetical protein [Pseudomonadales bacterium]
DPVGLESLLRVTIRSACERRHQAKTRAQRFHHVSFRSFRFDRDGRDAPLEQIQQHDVTRQ